MSPRGMRRQQKHGREGKTSWGKVGQQYHSLLEESKGSYHESVILPNVLRLLGLEKGERVLDVACGEGFFSRKFAEAGAVVTGVDISPEMIQIAKKSSPKEVIFFVSPAEELKKVQDGAFDKITLILAAQNIQGIGRAFAECRRVLSPNGSMVIVMNHPCFRIPKRSSWGWDQGARIQYRRLDGYFVSSEERIDMTPGSRDKKKWTVSFHRPLSSYVNMLSDAGFAVFRMEEWISDRKSVGTRASMENRARQEFPLFLALKVVPCAS